MVVVIFLSVMVMSKLLGLIINITPSMREGLYLNKSSSIKRGDIVAACIPNAYTELGIQRLYIGKGTACYGVMPIIKKVIALPGDNVVLTDHFIAVNGIQYPYKTEYSDSLGRPLTVYPRGHYPHTKGYWLIGTHSPHSWGSRYWGR